MDQDTALTIDNVINDANDIALSWYSILSGTPLPSGPPPLVPQGAAGGPGFVQPAPFSSTYMTPTQPWVLLGIVALVIGALFLSQR